MQHTPSCRGCEGWGVRGSPPGRFGSLVASTFRVEDPAATCSLDRSRLSSSSRASWLSPMGWYKAWGDAFCLPFSSAVYCVGVPWAFCRLDEDPPEVGSGLERRCLLATSTGGQHNEHGSQEAKAPLC